MSTKKRLYQSLILPILTYCSPVWRPNLLRDICNLERVQKRATRYIVNDPSLNYRERLCKLQMLPLMFQLELADILFTVSSIKNPNNHFNILQSLTFSSSNTRSNSQFKLKHNYSSNNRSRHSFFNRIPRLWNSLPIIDPSLPINTIKKSIIAHLIEHFMSHFDSDRACTYHYLCPCNLCALTPGLHF